jgi:hypothetical protein
MYDQCGAEKLNGGRNVRLVDRIYLHMAVYSLAWWPVVRVGVWWTMFNRH